MSMNPTIEFLESLVNRMEKDLSATRSNRTICQNSTAFMWRQGEIKKLEEYLDHINQYLKKDLDKNKLKEASDDVLDHSIVLYVIDPVRC